MKNKTLLTLPLIALFGAVSLASCAGENADPVVADKTIKDAYVNKDITVADPITGYNVYELELYTDNTYRFTSSTLQYGYGMDLGATVVVNEGNYTLGTESDGYTPVNLAAADHIVIELAAPTGGASIDIDSDNVTYPVEIPAATQGEKVYANSFEDLQNGYGAAKTYYVDDGNILYFTNPAA